MAFIRTKTARAGGNEYHYLVESYRNKDGQPRQRHLKYLGKLTGTGHLNASIRRNEARELWEELNEIEAAFFGDDDFADCD